MEPLSLVRAIPAPGPTQQPPSLSLPCVGEAHRTLASVLQGKLGALPMREALTGAQVRCADGPWPSCHYGAVQCHSIALQ